MNPHLSFRKNVTAVFRRPQQGVKFDSALRDEAVRRVKALNVPTVSFMLSPRLVPVLDAKGELSELKVSHDQDFIEQHLERSLL